MGEATKNIPSIRCACAAGFLQPHRLGFDGRRFGSRFTVAGALIANGAPKQTYRHKTEPYTSGAGTKKSRSQPKYVSASVARLPGESPRLPECPGLEAP